MKKMIQVIQDDSGSGKLLFQKPYVKKNKARTLWKRERKEKKKEIKDEFCRTEFNR